MISPHLLPQPAAAQITKQNKHTHKKITPKNQQKPPRRRQSFRVSRSCTASTELPTIHGMVSSTPPPVGNIPVSLSLLPPTTTSLIPPPPLLLPSLHPIRSASASGFRSPPLPYVSLSPPPFFFSFFCCCLTTAKLHLYYIMCSNCGKNVI